MSVAAEALRYDYATAGKGRVAALRDVSFRLKGGECLGVVGGPGAGKSTLARLLAGILAPGGGKLTVRGIAADGSRESRRLISGMVGYLPQWPERQLFARTVAEDVAAGLGRKKGESAGRVERALAASGLDPDLGSRPIFALSGAQARKAALAGVLVLERPILVLDEPTAGLDPASRREVASLLRGLKGEGRTLVVVSHRLEDIRPVADSLLVLREGESLFFGTVREAEADAKLAAGGAVEWPPVLELMLRLGRRFPGSLVPTDDPCKAGSGLAYWLIENK